MRLILGLGNPGIEHQGTRHNAGFEVLDRLARRHGDNPGGVAKARFSGLLVEARIGDERVLLLKPTTFMNLSGASVLEAVRFHKLDPAGDLLVAADIHRRFGAAAPDLVPALVVHEALGLAMAGQGVEHGRRVQRCARSECSGGRQYAAAILRTRR